MKKIIFSILLAISLNISFAQYYTPNPNNNTITYTVTRVFGNEELLRGAGNIAAYFVFDSIGKYWNMPTENDYLRFKILHFYTLNDRKNGEHWKKLYYIQKTALINDFDRYMAGRLKKKSFKISTEFNNTNYILKIYFVDNSTNVQYQAPYAVYQFIDSKTEKVVLQYHIEPKQKKSVMEYIDTTSDRDKERATFLDLSIAMSNYFRKHIKK
jgi:hypothetical protein